jgi:hypothetical protein
MKKALLALSILFSISAKAQNYSDSTVTLTLTQRAAVYIGYAVKNQFSWANRNAPTQLQPYIGSGANLDSLFTVGVKASYIVGLVEGLLAGPNEAVQADRLKIINNSPTTPGYTSLASQIVSKASGNTSEKQVAQFILDYYNQRVTDFSNLRTQVISNVVQWSRE